MKYKIFIIIISKTHLTMSNFAELQCFNKLLLKKMQRMQKKIEKLETENLILSNEEKEYRSLLDCLYTDEYCRCYICDLWNRDNDINWVEMEGGSERICDKCYEEKNYFNCNNCGEHYIENKEERRFENDGDIYCNPCYKGFILLDIIENNGYVGNISHHIINEMVYNKNEVTEDIKTLYSIMTSHRHSGDYDNIMHIIKKHFPFEKIGKIKPNLH